MHSPTMRQSSNCAENKKQPLRSDALSLSGAAFSLSIRQQVQKNSRPESTDGKEGEMTGTALPHRHHEDHAEPDEPVIRAVSLLYRIPLQITRTIPITFMMFSRIKSGQPASSRLSVSFWRKKMLHRIVQHFCSAFKKVKRCRPASCPMRSAHSRT